MYRVHEKCQSGNSGFAFVVFERAIVVVLVFAIQNRFCAELVWLIAVRKKSFVFAIAQLGASNPSAVR